MTTNETTRLEIPPLDQAPAQASGVPPSGRKELVDFLVRLRHDEEARARDRARTIRQANHYGEFSVTMPLESE